MYIIYGLIFIFFLTIDQITKYFAVALLQGNPSVHLIGNFLRFTYVENRGAAFGILQNQRLFFIISTVVLVAFLIYMIVFNKKVTTATKLTLSLILSGAIGNFIDRLRLGYVIDFVDVRFGDFYDFPVFNVADSCLVVGVIILVILILFNKFEKSENKV
ncbi:MAG TPA: signal peptidase II [Clostridiales bacterium]|nr:signal peptidase II [Clostridiales bacterium]